MIFKLLLKILYKLLEVFRKNKDNQTESFQTVSLCGEINERFGWNGKILASGR